MPIMVRRLLAVLLLLVVAGCVYQAIATLEAPPRERWAYWLIDGVVGFLSLLGAAVLLSPKTPRS
jgi:hypothetical protein